VEGISLTGSVTLGSNNSFIFVKALELDLNLKAAKVSMSRIYVVSNLLFQM
jgi:hypothetical protein